MQRKITTLFFLLSLVLMVQPFKMDFLPSKSIQSPKNIEVKVSQNNTSDNSIPNQAYNMTSYMFLGPNSLNSPKQLNTTFELMRNRVYCNTTWRVNNTLTYSISNGIFSYLYNHEGQNLKISPSNKEIMISNGSVDLSVKFKWQKRSDGSFASCDLTAKTTSYELSYIYQLISEPGKYSMTNLTEYYPLKLRQMTIPDWSDCKTSQEDKKSIMSLLNDVDSTDTVKELIEQNLMDQYRERLNSTIFTTPFSQSQYISYTSKQPYYSDTKLYFQSIPCGINLTKDGISYAYRLANQDFPEFEYSLIQPHPLDPSIYGDQQEFISFSHYRNFLMYAIQKRIIRKTFSQEGWSSTDFHFYVSELYDVFTNLGKRFDASATFIAVCQATGDFSKTKVRPASSNSLNVEMGWACRLDNLDIIGEFVETLANIDFTCIMQISGFPTSQTIDFWLRDFTLTSLQVDDSFGYKLQNKQKAEQIVSSLAKNMFHTRLTGSGWRFALSYDKPIVFVTQTGAFVTDLSFKAKSSFK